MMKEKYFPELDDIADGMRIIEFVEEYKNELAKLDSAWRSAFSRKESDKMAEVTANMKKDKADIENDYRKRIDLEPDSYHRGTLRLERDVKLAEIAYNVAIGKLMSRHDLARERKSSIRKLNNQKWGKKRTLLHRLGKITNAKIDYKSMMDEFGTKATLSTFETHLVRDNVMGEDELAAYKSFEKTLDLIYKNLCHYTRRIRAQENTLIHFQPQDATYETPATVVPHTGEGCTR